MFCSSLLNWIGLALLVIICRLLPVRLHPGWLGCGSILLLAYYDYAAAVLVVYLIFVAVLGGRLIKPGAAAGKYRSALWQLLGLYIAPRVLLKFQGIPGIDALQPTGVIQLDCGTLMVPVYKRLRRWRWLAVPAWGLTCELVSLGWCPFVFTLPQLSGVYCKGVAH